MTQCGTLNIKKRGFQKIAFKKNKIRTQAKIHHFAFKNSNIVIEGIIPRGKNYFL